MSVILIVEDDEQVRVLAESILQESGYETRSAGTSTEAKALLQSEEQIDLLFVDLHLVDHHEEGLELAQDAVKARPDLAVLYTTGRGVTDGMHALFVERNAFLAKPYNPEQLLTAVANLVKEGVKSAPRSE